MKITKIFPTDQKISGRGGITFFLRYLESTGLNKLIFSLLMPLVIFNSKSLGLKQFLKQMFAFYIDGTDMSISGFDSKKKDKGYASVLENDESQMASSHQIKRFISKLCIVPQSIFQVILFELFVWRLIIEKPKFIELYVDTMVMDNDNCKKKENCDVTYKRKKGFQPLHIIWNKYLVYVKFRKGSAHSNHEDDFIKAVEAIVNKIRTRYADVPIILKADKGFFDQKPMTYFEKELEIIYIISGKLYEDVKQYIQGVDKKQYKQYVNGKKVWEYFELGNKLKSWDKFRRCIFTRLTTDDDGQYLLDFEKTDHIIYTNIGQDEKLSNALREAGAERYINPEAIIELAHRNGENELVHRSLKELATKEQLPFKSFKMNTVYYFLLAITHFLFETYKVDISNDVVPIKSYPNTFRRRMIDIAVKITEHSRNVIMNVPRQAFNELKLNEMWEKCHAPPYKLAA